VGEPDRLAPGHLRGADRHPLIGTKHDPSRQSMSMKPARQAHRPSAASTRLAASLFASAVVVLLLVSVVDEWRFAKQRIGIEIAETSSGLVVRSIQPDSAAAASGLQINDRLISVAGQAVGSLDEFDALRARITDPELDLTIGRGSDTKTLSLRPGGPIDLTAILGQILLIGAYLGLAWIAAQYRQEDLRARLLMWFVSLIALEMAMPAGLTMNSTQRLALHSCWLLLTGVQIALELHLVSLIPKPLPWHRRHRRLFPAVWYALGAGVGVGLAGWQAWVSLEKTPPLTSWRDPTEFVMVAWALSVVLILLFQIATAASKRGRSQALLVLLGVLPWALITSASTLWPEWHALGYGQLLMLENLALFVLPLTVFIAIFRYGLFSIDRLVRRGLVYGSVAGLLMLSLYLLLTQVMPLIIDRFGAQNGLWLITVLAMAIGVAFRPLRNGVERVIEQGLFPERHELRLRLIAITSSLSSSDDLPVLLERLALEVRKALAVDWSMVHIESPAMARRVSGSGIVPVAGDWEQLTNALAVGSPIHRWLSQRRRSALVDRLPDELSAHRDGLRKLQAEALVPFVTRQQLTGILCLSSKRTGPFDREELELLDLFSHQVAMRVENLRLQREATYEEMTGLMRREAILQCLEAEWSRAARLGSDLSVCMIDLDHFKSINDAHGHLVGDRLLKEVAGALTEHVRTIDFLGRFGGEEFLLILPNTDEQGARKVAEKLRQVIANTLIELPKDNQAIGVTASFGVATMGVANQNSPLELLHQADQALFRAKSAGRNRINTLLGAV